MYRHGLMVLTWTLGMDMDSWYRHGLMVLIRTHGIDIDSWYRYRLMVLTTPMALTWTHGIESVLLNHTRTRGPSVTRMRDFFFKNIYIIFFFSSILQNKLDIVVQLVCYQRGQPRQVSLHFRVFEKKFARRRAYLVHKEKS